VEDAYDVLGLAPGATWEEVRVARRRLAKSLHPDLHSPEGRLDAQRRLARVNRAVDQLRAALSQATGQPASGRPAPAAQEPPVEPTVATRPGDSLSFTIEASPAVAFEAVLMAAVDLGDVIHVDEPTLLGILMDDPGPCQCIVELSAGAHGSVLTLDVGPRAYGQCPTVSEVRDALVTQVRRFFSEHP
jgi:hypothetical protein